MDDIKFFAPYYKACKALMEASTKGMELNESVAKNVLFATPGISFRHRTTWDGVFHTLVRSGCLTKEGEVYVVNPPSDMWGNSKPSMETTNSETSHKKSSG